MREKAAEICDPPGGGTAHSLHLTQAGGHLVQRDAGQLRGSWVIGVEREELLAQEPQALLLPARRLLKVIHTVVRGVKLSNQSNNRDQTEADTCQPINQQGSN